jgi:hypothetical protein
LLLFHHREQWIPFFELHLGEDRRSLRPVSDDDERADAHCLDASHVAMHRIVALLGPQYFKQRAASSREVVAERRPAVQPPEQPLLFLDHAVEHHPVVLLGQQHGNSVCAIV